jgi:Na+-transporting NADH:ubiquinone oxidoreductase subunit NqrD
MQTEIGNQKIAKEGNDQYMKAFEYDISEAYACVEVTLIVNLLGLQKVESIAAKTVQQIRSE